MLHEIERFGNDLHEAVFDSVVHHLDEMPGRTRSHVGDARFAIYLCRNTLQRFFDAVVKIAPAARHYARSVTGSFLTAADADTHKTEALCRQVGIAPVGVSKMRIAT